MKKLTALLLCILLLAGCAESYDGPTQTEYVLTRMTVEQYWIDGSLYSSRRTEYAYDICGNLAEERLFLNILVGGEAQTDSGADQKTVYTYDDRGNRTGAETYSLGGWLPRLSYRTEYTYDEQDRLILEVHENGGETSERRITYDDDRGTRTTVSPDGVTVEHFDEQGLLTREEITQGDRSEWHEYTYRPDGAPLTQRGCDADGTEYELRWDYDDQGLLTDLRRWEGESQRYHYRYEYDSQGREIRMLEITDSGRAESSRREYDDQNGSVTTYVRGEMSHTVFYDADGRQIKRLDYDSKTGEVGLCTTWTYTPIQVPAKEEAP